jgi:hypothetical protein
MLESLKSGGINNTGDLICTEHSLHRRLDEFDGDFPDNFAPDILCAKFLNSLRVILREDMRVFLRFFPGDGLISTKMASTSGPRQAGISEQLSIADRSKCVYELIMFIHYTFRENALLYKSMGLVAPTQDVARILLIVVGLFMHANPSKMLPRTVQGKEKPLCWPGQRKGCVFLMSRLLQ